MRRTPLWFATVLLASGFGPTLAVFAQDAKSQPKRVALLVGINHYEKRGFEDLHWAERDVDELRPELLALGFETVVVMKGGDQGNLSPTKDHIKSQLIELLAGFTKDDIALVALCGHGQQLLVRGSDGTQREDGFFCPVDAVLNEADTMLSLSDLTDNVLNRRGGKNLVLVDACRDGLIDANRAVRTRGIQGRLVSLPEDTAILFSCRAGQQSPERDDLQHGVFSYCVVEALRQSTGEEGDFTWSALVNGVQDGVARLNPGQEPIAAGAIGRVSLGRKTVNVPPDTCVVEMVLPPGAKVKVDGRDYGTRNRFKFNTLQPGKVYRSSLEVTLGDGQTVVFPLKIEGGRVLRHTIDPSEKKEGRARASQTRINGVWTGTYSYRSDAGRPPVEFRIQAVVEGDRVSGYIQEPNTFGDPSAPWLRASITGRYDKQARSISWTKTYDGTGNVSHTVHYWGRVSADGKRIENGTWEIPGDWSGTFVLEKKDDLAP